MKTFYIKDNVCTPYKLLLSRVARFFQANGWVGVDRPQEADLAIAGCCAAFHSLEAEALGLAREVVAGVSAGGRGESVLFGCLAGVSPEKAAALGPDHIICSPDWRDFARWLPEARVGLDDVDPATEFRLKEEYRIYDPGKQFVLIQTGCSSNCPHCPHKLGIGELASFEPDFVLDQVKRLAESGVHTVVVTGNDTGSWGTDLPGGWTFPALVRRMLEYPVNLHLAQVNPDWAHTYRDELLELLRDPRIKDFQVLIQTTSPRLLTIMRRKPVVRELGDFFARLREARPDIFLRTDLIMGYPTATEAEEAETVEYVIRYFDEVAVHGFERFEHTAMEGLGLPFFPRAEVRARTDRAVERLRAAGNILVHRGGQVYETMCAIEAPKRDIQRRRSGGAREERA